MQQTLYKNSSYLVFTSFYLLQTSALNRNLQRALVFLKAFLKKIQIHQKILKTLDLKIFSEEKPLRTLVLIKASKRKIQISQKTLKTTLIVYYTNICGQNLCFSPNKKKM